MRLLFALLPLALLALLGCGEAKSFDGGVRLPAGTSEAAAWSPDGRWIAIPNRKGVLLRGVDGNGRRQLSAPPVRRFKGQMPARISWSRDGSEIRYLTNIGPVEQRGAWVSVVPTDGGKPRQTALGTSIVQAAWAPGDWPLVFSTGPYAISGGGPVGPKPAIWSVEGFGAPAQLLLDLPGEEYEPDFSPSGQELTFVYQHRERRPAIALWLAASDGSRPRPLVTRLISCEPSWSPDGRRIAFAATTFSGGDRRQHLYVVSVDGGRPRLISRDEVRSGEPPAWTPDGRWVTYATYDGEIKRVRPDGGKRHTIADFDDREVRDLMWSPDGDHLAYSAQEIVESD
jgi:Tol biopolymer transport system component